MDLYGEALCDVNMEKTFLVSLLNGSYERHLKFRKNTASDAVASWTLRENKFSLMDINVFPNPLVHSASVSNKDFRYVLCSDRHPARGPKI